MLCSCLVQKFCQDCEHAQASINLSYWQVLISHELAYMSVIIISESKCAQVQGGQWLGGRVLDLRPRGRRFEPHRGHCVVSLSKNINPSLVLVQPRKTGPFITERL